MDSSKRRHVLAALLALSGAALGGCGAELDGLDEVGADADENTASVAQAVNSVFWVDWTSQSANGVVGTVNVGGQPVTVTYTGEKSFAQTSGGTNYWNPSAPYISATVPNAPPTPDIIALHLQSAKQLTFSQAVTNPLFAVVSLNGNGYRFNRDFNILSFGCGYWGCGTLTKKITPPPGGVAGDPGTTYDLIGSGEPHGVIQFIGTFSTVSWDSLSNENWNGFSIAIADLAVNVSPEIAVLDNGAPLVDGQATALDFGGLQVGQSVTRSFTITNSGTGPLTFTGTTFTGANAGDFSLASPLPAAIAAGASATLTVKFAPKGGGARSASIHIGSDDADENPFDLPLSGSATVPCVTLARGVLGNLADTQVAENRPTKNYGSGLAMIAGVVDVNLGDSGDRRALVRPDLSLIPAGSTVVSATLTLIGRDNDGGPGPLNAHVVTSFWSEGAATWNNQPSFDPAILAAAAGGAGPQVFDITSAVAGWLAAPASNYGVLLEQSSNRTNFITSEDPTAANRPKLDVCYLPPSN